MTGATIEVVSGEQLRVASVASASAKLDDQKPANNFITSDITSAPKCGILRLFVMWETV